MARKRARFIPRLEAFDDRSLPSVTVTELSGGGLMIEGDATANQIRIEDNGTGEAGAVVVYADGQTYVSQGPITHILVTTNGGDDVVDYWLQGTLVTDRTVSVDLGVGRDAFTAHLDDQTVAAGVDLLIGGFGRRGADRLVLDAQRVNVGAAGRLIVDYQGGAGKDVVTFNYLPGLVDGTVSLLTDQRK